MTCLARQVAGLLTCVSLIREIVLEVEKRQENQAQRSWVRGNTHACLHVFFIDICTLLNRDRMQYSWKSTKNRYSSAAVSNDP